MFLKALLDQLPPLGPKHCFKLQTLFETLFQQLFLLKRIFEILFEIV